MRRFFRRRYNGHVRSEVRSFEGVHKGHGLGEMNAKGNSILEFSSTYDLTINNKCFRKRDEHLITYKSKATCSQIDFFLLEIQIRRFS